VETLVQLVLPVLQKHDFHLDNFIADENLSAIRHVRNRLSQRDSPSSAKPITFLFGAPGTGKTHLLLAFHQYADDIGLQGQYVDMRQVQKLPPPIIQGIGSLDLVCIDNIDAVSADGAWQVQLFDAINQFIENGGKQFLVSSSRPLQSIEFSLPDLASRLQWGTTFQLHDLDETHKTAALAAHFLERGIGVQEEVITFLMRRCERDMHKLVDLVDKLDKMSLQQKRKLTIPFIKDALSI
jgi:DnaA family protein